MCLIQKALLLIFSRGNPCCRGLKAWMLAAMVSLGAVAGAAQNAQNQATPTPTPSANAPAEAGGPTGDIGPIAVPKKKEEPPKKEEPAPTPKKVEGLDNFSMTVRSQLVTLDVGVLSKDGTFIPDRKSTRLNSSH